MPKPLAQDAAAFDTGLSVKMLSFLRHLHAGRLDPRAIGFRMTAPADDHDFTAPLRAALGSHRITDTATEAAPPLALYRRLHRMLARYPSLAADPTLGSLPPPGADSTPRRAVPGTPRTSPLARGSR